MSVFTNPYILAIIGYLSALIGVGYYKSRVVETGEDFMVAGRTLPWYILVGTLLATWIGNGSLFAGAGLGYRNGLAGLWSSAGAWAGILLVYFIATRIRNFGQVTVPDIFEARYGSVAGVLAILTTVVAYVTIVSYQFRGGGRILELITDGAITVETGIVITAVFAVLYTVLAGMLSVVYTDVVNGVIMVIGVLGALIFLVPALGGMDTIIGTAEAAGKWELFGNWEMEQTDADGTPIASGPLIALSFFIPTMLLLMGDGNMYQRIFSSENGGEAKKAVFFWIIGVIVLETAISFLGLAGSVAAEQGMIPDLFGGGPADVESNLSENVIPMLAADALPLVLGMILVATMMAIVVSTADSFLLVPATNLTRDVMQRYVAPDMSQSTVVLVNRLWVIVLGVLAYLLVEAFPTILEAAYTAYLIYGAAITPALVATFLWKRATWQGAVASIATGALVTLVWTFYLSEQPFYETWHPLLQEETFPAVVLSVGTLVGVSYATPAPDDTVWAPFFIDDEAPDVAVEDLIEQKRQEEGVA